MEQGLEYAETKPNPKRTNFRYALGVAAPAVAWPTLLMPVEYALIGQFSAFMGLYFFDSKASTRGWAPSWYGTYRFVLTFVVGSAIMVSLTGRARIGEGGTSEAAERISDSKHGRVVREMPEAQWRRLEAEEKERIRKEKEEAERRKEEDKEKQKKKNDRGAAKGKGKEKKAADSSQEKQEKQEKRDKPEEDGGVDNAGEEKSDQKEKKPEERKPEEKKPEEKKD